MCARCSSGAPATLSDPIRDGEAMSYQEQWRRFRDDETVRDQKPETSLATSPHGKTWAHWQRELAAARWRAPVPGGEATARDNARERAARG
jgi:hypothetical protein